MRGKRISGFTLVEIMIVVGIIGIILAMAMPNFMSSRRKARSKACINNLHQIHGAKQQWALDTNATATDTPTSADLAPVYLQMYPSCPAAGTYGIKAINTVPTCSIGTGVGPETWDDHIF